MPPASVGAEFTRLVEIMHRLRAPGGCPWDREQTPESLRPFLLEEAHEVLDAIAANDPPALCDELGDLLLQVLFHAEIAEERGAFHVGDVIGAITDKLIRRHPHVFAEATASTAAEVVENWQRIKAAERRAAGEPADAFVDVPRTLPGLARAQKVADRAARVGFDWDDVAGVVDKLREEQRELETALSRADHPGAIAELGDLLLTATSLARHLGADAEMALRDATDRLVARVRHCSLQATARGLQLADLDAATRDCLWDAAKRTV